MLITSFFILLTAAALRTIQSTATLLTRTLTLSFLFTVIIVLNGYSWNSLGTGMTLYNGLLNVTGVVIFAQVILLVLGAISLTPWAPINIGGLSSQPRISTYPLFALMSLIGSSILVSSGDQLTFYLALELQSFSVYVMAALYRDSERATHAGLLYFLLGGLSSCIILLGFALIYSQTGTTSFEDIIILLNVNWGQFSMDQTWGILLGIICVQIGLLFKITAAPFHNWGPDVYDGVPTIITTWLAVMPKISLVILILTLGTGLNGVIQMSVVTGESYDIWSTLMLISSVISLIVGTMVGLAQTRIKRLLAYSTVSHVGFILIALSLSTQESAAATILYLVQYSLTAILSFSAVLALGYQKVMFNQSQTADLGLIEELMGASKHNPAVSVSLATSLFSIAGVPPLLGFYGKQAVLYSALNSNLYFVSVVAVVTSIISASYYLYLVRVSHFDNNPQIETNFVTENTTLSGVGLVQSYLLSLLTGTLIGFMASPDLLLDSCRLVALTQYSV